jgi:hypothetical protein
MTLILGHGQMVYWKGSNVTVIEKDNNDKEQRRKLTGKPDGQGLAESGTELYITRGKVQEG